MILYPKLDSTFVGEDRISSYITTGVEVQLLDLHVLSLSNVVDTLKSKYQELDTITFHLPMHSCDIEFILANNILYTFFQGIIDMCIFKSVQYKMHINVLAHSAWTYEMLSRSCLTGKLIEIVNTLDGSNVKLLLENTPTFLEHPFEQESSVEVVRTIQSHNLKACFDICHLHCVFNMLKKDFDYLNNYYQNDLDLSHLVNQIHFSGTLKNDGYIESKATHSKTHETMTSTLDDLDILKKLNIFDKPLVIEICEDGPYGWIDRFGQLEELKLLSKIREIYKI